MTQRLIWSKIVMPCSLCMYIGLWFGLLSTGFLRVKGYFLGHVKHTRVAYNALWCPVLALLSSPTMYFLNQFITIYCLRLNISVGHLWVIMDILMGTLIGFDIHGSQIFMVMGSYRCGYWSLEWWILMQVLVQHRICRYRYDIENCQPTD
jgi:hypothetical protein